MFHINQLMNMFNRRGGMRFLFCLAALTLVVSISTLSVAAQDKEVEIPKLSKEEVGQLKEEANKLFWQGKYEQSRLVCAKLLMCMEKNKTKKEDYPRLLINLGILNVELDKPEKAFSIFQEAKELLTKGKFKSQKLNYADCLTGLAECRYLRGRSEVALENYKEAYEIYQNYFSRYSLDLIPVLEGLGGCYVNLKKFDEALPYYRLVAQIDLIDNGAKHPRVGLSFHNLSDLYYRQKDCAKARPFFSQSIWIFRKNSMDALLKEYSALAKKNSFDKEKVSALKKRINEVVMGVQDPPQFRSISYKLLDDEDFSESCRLCENKRPEDFDNWQFSRSDLKDSGFIRIDPTVEQKGLLVCVHGLGLSHRSYWEFAEKINKLGYAVLAIDVRGFGALSYEKGFDKIDLEAGLNDLESWFSILRFSNADLPLYLLGESMGGALALQFTAIHPKLVDGLISSVPSGRRFKSKRTKLLVGIKLLDDPNKPFSIGKKVVEQATAKKDLKDNWINDPANRLKLSAQELVHFENFMRHNEEFAKQITKTPVIVFQGFKDHLVRPTGTYALYQALATSEKDLLFVGNREHLVFEEGQASNEVVSMLAAWLDSHIDQLVESEEEKISESP